MIIEDELITASSIQELLEGEDYAVIGVAADAARAMQLCATSPHAPALAICDVNIKGSVNGIALAEELKNRYQCEIIFLTAYADAPTLDSAFQLEPVMYVVKPYSDKQLLAAVQMAFHRYFRRQQTDTTTTLQLTPREAEIARLVAQGLSSKQIAQRLFISEETVKTHRRRMLQKNDVSSFTQLVYLLSKEG